MIMIAGLRKYDKRNDRSGIPILSRIPILGLIFGAKATLNKVTELIVFVTPTIMKGDAMIAGTEPESVFPADVAPRGVRERIMKRIMAKENINIGESEAQRIKIGTDISSKAKGLKEY